MRLGNVGGEGTEDDFFELADETKLVEAVHGHVIIASRHGGGCSLSVEG